MRRNCIICQDKIYRSKFQTKYKLRRGKNALTCSKKCARTYGRVRTHLKGLIDKRKRKRKKK